jgi:dsRNA-specific ribonuclease
MVEADVIVDHRLRPPAPRPSPTQGHDRRPVALPRRSRPHKPPPTSAHEETPCPPRPTSNRPHGPPDEVFELIRDRLADILEIDPARHQEGDSFADDLEADSLALIELVEASRRRSVSAPSASASRTRTSRTSRRCGDAVDYVVQIGEVLLLGKGEQATGGRQRPSILADAMEAVFGAVYLDGGLAAVTELIVRLVEPRLATAGAPDHKSQLHELMARERGTAVRYEITEHGPEHDKTFHAVVVFDGQALGEGVGRSKKQAEQHAARVTWQRLQADNGEIPAGEEATHG